MRYLADLETDSNGDIITQPLTGWTTATLAGIAVLLAFQCVETPLELETGSSKSIQLVLTPEQCLELAERLTELAMSLLEVQSYPGKPAN